MPQSSTTRFLSGKRLPGYSQKVTTVNKSQDGRSRIVHFENGTSIRVPKQKLVKAFNDLLTQQQRARAIQSIRVKPGGKASVTIGGAIRGERKIYGSVGAAKAAVTRAYGK